MKQDEYPRPNEHAPHCPAPEYEWQAEIWTGLARRGRCIHCGAIEIHRQETVTGQPPVGRAPRRVIRHATEKGDAQ